MITPSPMGWEREEESSEGDPAEQKLELLRAVDTAGRKLELLRAQNDQLQQQLHRLKTDHREKEDEEADVERQRESRGGETEREQESERGVANRRGNTSTEGGLERASTRHGRSHCWAEYIDSHCWAEYIQQKRQSQAARKGPGTE